MITLFGISNCDTMRKSGKWLDSQDVDWVLHDYRKHGLDQALASALLTAFGAETLINKRGTTWRQLDAGQQSRITDQTLAIELIIAFPALIKRPIARTQADDWLIGYDQLSTLSPSQA
jgi:Spx/MgsR family transcriptional regulator